MKNEIEYLAPSVKVVNIMPNTVIAASTETFGEEEQGNW